MEFESQIYRAPSVPKINRRNISSSVMRGAQSAATPKLRRSTFSFIKPRVTAASLKSESIQADALVETNRILVEIQKQLALDFATRIAEKREGIRGYKQRISRERASRKEQAIESIGKFGSNITKAFDKVVAPAKGIFQRILDFFTIIATGLIVNNAFNWLSKKENQEKITKFFGFLANHWKELLAIFGTYKLLKLILKIKRFLDLFKRKPPNPPGGGRGGGGQPGGGGGPAGGGCGPVFNCIAGIGGTAAELLAQQLRKTRAFRPLFAPPVGRPPAIIPPTPTGQPVQKPKQKPQGKPWWQTALDIADIALDIASIVAIIALLIPMIPGDEPLAPPLIGRLAAKYGIKTGIGRGAAAAAKNPIPKRPVGTTSGQFTNTTRIQLTKIAKNNPDDLIQYLNSSDKTAREIARQLWQKSGRELPQGFVLKSTGGTIPGFSVGGTVGGTGPGNVDSVPVKLAPGEEVVRTSAANLFRPLLKDINNNAGRKWNEFSIAIRDMVSHNENMRVALSYLNSSLETFRKQLDEFVVKEKQKKSPKGGGVGLRTPQSSSPTLILPTLLVHSDLKKPTKQVTRTTIPINLPTKTADHKLPALDGGMVNEEPDISTINYANDYMMLTPKMYGIFV